MRAQAWAILGSLAINLMLALAVAAVFSASPPVRAAESARCSTHPAASGGRATPAGPGRPGQRYIVAVRMGWAMG